MHIALYSPAWPLEQFQNGIVTFVHFMRIELERLGHRVSIFTGRLELATPDPHVHLVRPGRLDRLRGLGARRLRVGDDDVWRWGRVLAAAVLEVHRLDPIDIIEMEESFGWSAAVEATTRLPVLVKLHGPAFDSLVEEELASAFGQERVVREGRALQDAQAIAAPSADTLARTLARYSLRPAISAHVVNPLNVDLPLPLWKLETSRPDSLLFVGRFDRRKGGDVMLRAFELLLRARPNLQLVFVGPDYGVVQDDGARSNIEQYIAAVFPAELRQRVDYRGRLANQQIPALRCDARVVVVPSRWENQSYAVVEALLQGCPVVASDVGGIPESVIPGRTGWLARPGDPVDLAAQLEQALDQPDLAAAFGAAGRCQVIEQHATRRVAEQSLALYERVIANARNRR